MRLHGKCCFIIFVSLLLIDRTNMIVYSTMLGAWLVELYLAEREEDEKSDISERRNDTQLMMQNFLTSNTYNMDAKTILRIMCSHNVAASECSLYAASAGDIGTAVNASLCDPNYKVRFNCVFFNIICNRPSINS